jgi:hypothetical protein
VFPRAQIPALRYAEALRFSLKEEEECRPST